VTALEERGLWGGSGRWVSAGLSLAPHPDTNHRSCWPMQAVGQLGEAVAAAAGPRAGCVHWRKPRGSLVCCSPALLVLTPTSPPTHPARRM
jgi:hypothetical protein